jgi:hypothetical protein
MEWVYSLSRWTDSDQLLQAAGTLSGTASVARFSDSWWVGYSRMTDATTMCNYQSFPNPSTDFPNIFLSGYQIPSIFQYKIRGGGLPILISCNMYTQNMDNVTGDDTKFLKKFDTEEVIRENVSMVSQKN